MSERRAAWTFVAPALLVIGVFFLAAGARRVRCSASPTSICTRSPTSTTCASSASTTTSTCCRRRCSGSRSATRSISSSSACRCRSPSRLARRCCSNSPLARFKGLFRTALFAPVVTTRRRRRGDLAIPVPHALRPDQLRARAARHRADRLARRSALVDAGDHPVRGVEELRLQHDHPARRRCKAFRATCTKPRASTAHRAWQQFRHITLPIAAAGAAAGRRSSRWPATSSCSPSPT